MVDKYRGDDTQASRKGAMAWNVWRTAGALDRCTDLLAAASLACAIVVVMRMYVGGRCCRLSTSISVVADSETKGVFGQENIFYSVNVAL